MGYLKEHWAKSQKTWAADLALSFPNYVSYLGDSLKPSDTFPYLCNGCSNWHVLHRIMESFNKLRWTVYYDHRVTTVDTVDSALGRFSTFS